MRRQRGFTILEVLIVVAIIGIIAAIAMANYLNALQRTKQKRTMADIRSVAIAWESRAVDTKAYNAAAVTFNVPPSAVTYTDLNLLLSIIRSAARRPRRIRCAHPAATANSSATPTPPARRRSSTATSCSRADRSLCGRKGRRRTEVGMLE